MNNLFQFMCYFKSKMVPLLQLRYFSTIFLYYFKEKNSLLKQIERKKEREKERKKKKDRWNEAGEERER